MYDQRGFLIVLEGCDRAGKSTQSQRILQHLQSHHQRPCELFRFPNRTTMMGKMIDQYLQSKLDIDDHALHLLFSANRWEMRNEMMDKLNKGITLVVDRYAYSGVVFSMAKGLERTWCHQSDQGLPRPDLVFFLDLPVEDAIQRGDFGQERYELVSFQRLVYTEFQHFFHLPYWKRIDARPSMDHVTHSIQLLLDQFLYTFSSTPPPSPIQTLWQV